MAILVIQYFKHGSKGNFIFAYQFLNQTSYFITFTMLYVLLTILPLFSVEAKESVYPEKLRWSESKFVLSGKPNEYVNIGEVATSLQNWASRYDHIYI